MIRYLKHGRSFRSESASGGPATIELSEHGFALEDDGLFSCGSLESDSAIVEPDRSAAVAIAAAVSAPLPPNVLVERRVVVSGSAQHAIESDEPICQSRTWTENFVRVHLSLMNRRHRLRSMIDLGAGAPSQIPLEHVPRIARAMADWNGEHRSTPGGVSVTLPPDISAALLVHLAVFPSLRSGLGLTQSNHNVFRFDGYGTLIEEHPLSDDFPPNFFRPSFRSRPTRVWFHIDTVAENSNLGAWDYRAEALLGPIRSGNGRIALGLLCRALDEAVFAVEIDLDADGWLRAISGTSSERTWFPFAAGSWGRTLLVRL
ncbi:MAG: hypothetical protein ABI718_12455 [Acidobacteriota bacterium]